MRSIPMNFKIVSLIQEKSTKLNVSYCIIHKEDKSEKI